MRGTLTRLAVVISLAALLGPVLLASIPPLTDYPNHLSRLWLLGGGATLPPVDTMYRVTWDTFTNLGIDLSAVALLRLFDYELVGRILVAAAVLLPPVGGVVLWRSLHGRLHWWQLAFGLLAWGTSLLAGFLNFQIGVGLAMLFAAADPALARRGKIALTAGRLAFASVLILVHLFGLLFYAGLVAGMLIGPRLPLRRPALVRTVKHLAVLAVTLALPLVLLLLLAPSLPGKQVGAGLGSFLDDFRMGFAALRAAPIHKLERGLLAIRAYSNKLDAATGAVLVAPVVIAAALSRLAVHAGMLLTALLFALCFLVFPDLLAGTYWIDTRFALMAPFALAAALVPELPGAAAGAALLAFSLLRTGTTAWIWHARQDDVAALARALDGVPPGEAILPLEQRPRGLAAAPPGRYASMGESSFRHLATLALPWHRDFVPTLFASRGKQPLEILPPWDAIAEPEGGRLANAHALESPAGLAAALPEAPYLAQWRAKFGYILLVNADLPDGIGPFVPPDGVTLVRDAGFARLYRIVSR